MNCFFQNLILYVCYRNNVANESKSAMLEFFEHVYNYYSHKKGASFFFLDLMHLHFDDWPETLKFVKNDEMCFRKFFQKKLELTPLIMYTIFQQVHTYLVQP